MEARAAGAPAPLRFLVIHHPLGAQVNLWRAAAPATTKTFTLPIESAAFGPLQSKMVMIDGLNIVTATKVPGGPDGAKTHEGGMVALMTGQPTLGKVGQQDHCAGGASIDQIFLAKSPVLGGLGSTSKTPFGSLQLAADIRSDRDEKAPRFLSYLDPDLTQSSIDLQRRPLAVTTQPLDVFTRLFGGAVSGTNTNVAAVMAQQKSVLDFMRADLARLRTLAPASEKIRLDSQAEAIRQLEFSIQASIGTGTTTSMSCMKPMAPMSFANNGAGASGNLAPAGGSMLHGVDYYDPTNPMNHPHQVLGQLQLMMIRAAFACDLVRVATFMWSAGTNWVVFPGTMNGTSIAGGPVSSPHHPPSHTTDVHTMAWLSQINTFYSGETAKALQAFDSTATPDVDGNTLLDNTVVAYVSEVARAYDHDQRNMPYLVFGGKNTRVQGGTFLKVANGPLPTIDGSNTGNRPTNDVWLALAPVFGVNMASLGAPAQSTGPLPGVIV